MSDTNPALLWPFLNENNVHLRWGHIKASRWHTADQAVKEITIDLDAATKGAPANVRSPGVYLVAAFATPPAETDVWPFRDLPVGARILYVGRSTRLASRVTALLRTAGLIESKSPTGHSAGHRLWMALDGYSGDIERTTLRFAWITPAIWTSQDSDDAYLWSTVVEALVLRAVAKRTTATRLTDATPVGPVLPQLQHRGWVPLCHTGDLDGLEKCVQDALSAHPPVQRTAMDVATRLHPTLTALFNTTGTAAHNGGSYAAICLRAASASPKVQDAWLCVGDGPPNADAWPVSVWIGGRLVAADHVDAPTPYDTLASRIADVLCEVSVGTSTGHS